MAAKISEENIISYIQRIFSYESLETIIPALCSTKVVFSCKFYRNAPPYPTPAPTALILVLLNKLRRHTHFYFSANQITLSRLFLYSHILKGKQCRSRSVGFRNQLIWSYTVCKGRVYPGSAGQGLNLKFCRYCKRVIYVFKAYTKSEAQVNLRFRTC